jgi:serine/threonine-protein kinase
MNGISDGDIIAGKYRVEKTLGSGGMGFVVAAHHLHLDQKVAIKCLLPEILGSPEAVARFMREAQAAVKITSEHVARVLWAAYSGSRRYPRRTPRVTAVLSMFA